MKKHMLLISAIANGAALSLPASPTSDAVALRQAADALYADNTAKVRAAKAIGDTAAVKTIIESNRESSLALANGQAPVVAGLIGAIDTIAQENPSLAIWLIQRHLSAVNRLEDGTMPVVYAQTQADIDLAKKLLTIGTGNAGHYYLRHYSTVDELASEPGTSSSSYIEAVIRRAVALDVRAEILAPFFERSVGKGAIHQTYKNWFRQKVRAIAEKDKLQAITLLDREQNAVENRADGSAPAVVKYIDELRLQADRLAERIAREKKISG
jgi:hypothetical protein